MVRRNIVIIVIVGLVSLACYARVDHNRHGRYLSQVLTAVERWALKPVAQQELFDAAMQGIVSRLDEYSVYISAKDAEAFEAELQQEFGGIGVVVSPRDGQPTVVQPPLYGTPALKAGIRVGDRILEIDGVPTTGMPMGDVTRRMRGRKGDPLELTILHEGATEPIHLRLIRETINIPSVLGDRRRSDGTWDFRLRADPRIGYIRVATFGEKTVDELEAALTQLALARVEALILDLRDDAGGLLSAAVATCELFLPAGKVIVEVRGRDGMVEVVERSGGPGTCLDLPMAVLVNRYTASAAEIVAACLQDHERAAIAGEQTWGKGTVQHVIPIEAGRSLLKLTTATYFRPSGKNIHRAHNGSESAWGIVPDEGLSVPLTEEQKAKIREDRARRDAAEDNGHDSAKLPNILIADPELAKAVEYLQSKLDGASKGVATR